MWQDTVLVRPGEEVQVAFKAGNPGIWMDHCHNYWHSKLGMVMHLAYDNVTTPYEVGGRKDPIRHPLPCGAVGQILELSADVLIDAAGLQRERLTVLALSGEDRPGRCGWRYILRSRRPLSAVEKRCPVPPDFKRVPSEFERSLPFAQIRDGGCRERAIGYVPEVPAAAPG
ncbi:MULTISPECIES: multicopper oxidase domain-containing protein [unclassified Streptomyces]